jgi:CRP-like cAMP-binding protein
MQVESWKIDIEKKKNILRNISIFTETDEEMLHIIALHLTCLSYRKDELIFGKGELGDSMYIIVQGNIKVFDDDHIFTVLKQGDVFGEYSLFDSQIRSASVAALIDTIVLQLDQKTFFQIVNHNPEIIRRVLRTIINRLHDKDTLEAELAKKNVEIQQQKEEIITQRDEIEAQRDEIEQKNKDITDSIQYARLIQTAILPPDNLIIECFPENFIIYKPRDIVSGDFYWLKRFDRYIVIAVADCTGHGVPGAFMSMLGVSLLNEIVILDLLPNADLILNNLRQKIKTSLRQTGKGNETHDGMDLSFCIIDCITNNLYYSGANSPIYIARNIGYPAIEGTKKIENNHFGLYHIKADTMPIGIYLKEAPFTKRTVKLYNKDTLYLFSDGIVDQIGGQHNKKFMTTNFKLLLLSIQDKSMKDQGKILINTLQYWMGNQYEQVDDILVIGIKFISG